MVVVDTSVWISHFRDGDDHLSLLLNEGEVLCHTFIIGELACGNLKNRVQILSLLNSLPKSVFVNHKEILFFIEKIGLMGKGLGYIDMSLLASSLITESPIWTLDKRLQIISSQFKLNYSPNRRT